MRVDHPDEFKTGLRVLLLKGRHKDGIQKERKIVRITHDPGQFDRHMDELIHISTEGERVYATAGPRNIRMAMRVFKERQLESEYDADPTKFYERLEDRWASAIMSPRSQLGKLWLFDIDRVDQQLKLGFELQQLELLDHVILSYPSKSGHHVITKPFNKTLLSTDLVELIHDNPLMLWYY